MTKKIIPATKLHDYLKADFGAGKLFWRERPLRMFSRTRLQSTFNSRYAHKEALTAKTSDGYKKGIINGQCYRAHRVLWAMAFGHWPDCPIDHINGDPADNRLCNLRKATTAQNQWNVGIRADNSSGYKGVYWCGHYEKWAASICANKKRFNLGHFLTAEDAAAAYQRASEELHGRFSNTGGGPRMINRYFQQSTLCQNDMQTTHNASENLNAIMATDALRDLPFAAVLEVVEAAIEARPDVDAEALEAFANRIGRRAHMEGRNNA